MEVKGSDLRSLQMTADAWGFAYLRVTRESVQAGCGGQVFNTTDATRGHWSGKPCVTIGICHEYGKPILTHGIRVTD